jgi:hypothetical protein
MYSGPGRVRDGVVGSFADFQPMTFGLKSSGTKAHSMVRAKELFRPFDAARITTVLGHGDVVSATDTRARCWRWLASCGREGSSVASTAVRTVDDDQSSEVGAELPVRYAASRDRPSARFVRSVLHITLVLRTLRNLTVRHVLSLVIRRAQQKPPARLPAPSPAGVFERESVLAAALTLVSVRARSRVRPEGRAAATSSRSWARVE